MRVLFNLALVFVAGVLVVVSGLYAYVLYVLNESGDPSGAVASVEPQKGAIRALADQKDDFSLAPDARRQPGSSFKPFVLATALREFVSQEATYYLTRNLDFDYEGEGPG